MWSIALLSFYIRALRCGSHQISFAVVGMWALQALHVAGGGESHRAHSHATTPRRRPCHENPSGSLRPSGAPVGRCWSAREESLPTVGPHAERLFWIAAESSWPGPPCASSLETRARGVRPSFCKGKGAKSWPAGLLQRV